MERYAASLVGHRGRWTVLAGSVLALAVGLATTLGVRINAADFLPRGASAPGSSLAGALPVDPTVVVVESAVPLQPGQVAPLLDTLASRIRRLPGVRRVEHRLPAELQRYLAEALPARLLQYYTPAGIDSLAERLARPYLERALLGRGAPVERTRVAAAMGVARTDPLGVVDPALRRLRELGGESRVRVMDGYFTVPDQRSWFVLVEPGTRPVAIAEIRAQVAAIDSVVAGVDQHGLRVYQVGRAVAVVAGTDMALRDVRRVAAAAAVSVLLVLMLALGRWWGPLLIIGTVAAGITLTAAVAAVLVDEVNLVSWTFIAALVGFGDEFALYIVSHYWLTARPGSDRASALAEALRRPGPGVALGALTTAVAFVSLGVIRYRVMTELAWFSTLGILLILAAAFTLLPLALAWTAPGQARTAYRTRATRRPRRVRVPRWAALSGWAIGTLAFATVAATRLEVSLHPWALAVRGVPQSADLAELSDRLGASLTPFLMVSRAGTEGEALAAERRALAALQAVRHDAGIASIVALSPWVPDSAAQQAALAAERRRAVELSPRRLRRDWDAVMAMRPDTAPAVDAEYLPGIVRHLTRDTAMITVAALRAAGLDDLVARHLVHRDGEVLAIAQVYPTAVPWSPGVVERFQRALAGASPEAFRQVEWVGEALQGASRTTQLRRDVLLACGSALALTLLVLWLRFRRVVPVLLSLVPVGCGLAAVLGTMALAGVELNLITLVAVPVILGLGSDDGIHIVDRLERGEAIDRVVHDTSTPMTITTLTTIVGFACLGLARFPDVAAGGVIASLGLLVCLAASLHLLPLLARER